MTVYMVISLQKIPYTHRIYMVLANPTHVHRRVTGNSALAQAGTSDEYSHNHRQPSLLSVLLILLVQYLSSIVHKLGWPEPYISRYIRYFWQGNHHTYSHIRCVYTVLANPVYVRCCFPFCSKRETKEHAINKSTPHVK
jgi:hypothetical protein